MDETIKYLEIIQGIVSRMAANQFQARAWSVSLGTAAIGFAASKDGNLKWALLALIPATLFWRLDAYFLTLERGYRVLYDRARMSGKAPDFALTVDSAVMNEASAGKKPAWRSDVVPSVHLPVILLALVVGGYGLLFPAKPGPPTCVACPPVDAQKAVTGISKPCAHQ